MTFVNSEVKSLWACVDGRQRSLPQRVELVGQATDVVLPLVDAPGVVRGRVTAGSSGAPLGGVLVVAYPPPTRPRRPPSYVWTRADGTMKSRRFH